MYLFAIYVFVKLYLLIFHCFWYIYWGIKRSQLERTGFAFCLCVCNILFSSVSQSCPTPCNPMNHSTAGLPVHHQLQVYPNSCPLSQWCHPTISSSVIPLSSCLQSFSTSGSFQMSQLFTSGGQNIGVSASTSVLPMNTQDWSPLGRTGWISLQSKGLSRVSSNTTVQKHQFFSVQLSL